MASVESKLERLLVEVGNGLLPPPSSVDELIHRLDLVEKFLLLVDQLPSKSMRAALGPCMSALVTDELLRHPDVDVKAAVAACISEITRITAPNAPYDDDQMKDVFQLIVSSFEELSNNSSRLYKKRILVLETVAKVRSCVVMLDLECDGLIVEMFQHFLKAIRDFHPENVFSSMEAIMTLVLEESEDISLELISPILASLKRHNQEVLPIARKLGERVFENCRVKLKPCLIEAKKSIGLSLDDYSEVVASICCGNTEADEHNTENAQGEQAADENKLVVESPDNTVQETKKSAIETCPEGGHLDVDGSPKLVMGNGVSETGNDDKLPCPKPSKNHAHETDQSVDTNVARNAETEYSASGKIAKSEFKAGQILKKRGRKPKALLNSAGPSDYSQVDGNKEDGRTVDCEKIPKNEVCSSLSVKPSVGLAVPSENDKGDIQLPSPKILEGEPTSAASPSPSGHIPNEGHQKRVGRQGKKDNLIKEVLSSADNGFKRASEMKVDSEIKPERHAVKTSPAGLTTSDLTVKLMKQFGRKLDASDTVEGESLSTKAGKRHGRGIATSKKESREMISSLGPTSKLAKAKGHLEETREIISKRKRASEKKKSFDTPEYGESLVGSKIKVWWPQDKMFYEGVVDSFDLHRKRHKVLYNDGDEEILNLRKERWDFLEEELTESRSPDLSPEMNKKKAKINIEPSAVQGIAEGSCGGEGSSRKLKGASTISGRKSRDDNKNDAKLNDETPGSPGKFEADILSNSKDTCQKVGDKSLVGGGTPKTSAESKRASPNDTAEGILKNATKSKRKAPQSGDKSDANGSGKVESGSVVKMTNDAVKSQEPSKRPRTGEKSGKKMKQGAKS